MRPNTKENETKDKRLKIQYENIVGKVNLGRALDMRKIIEAGAQHDTSFPGVLFDTDRVVVKVYESGKIIVYGAKDRDVMLKELNMVLKTIGLRCKPEDLTVFLVVGNTNIGISIKTFKDTAIRSLQKSYTVVHDHAIPFPGIILKKNTGTDGHILATLYMTGYLNCEGPSKKAIQDSILEIDRLVREAWEAIP